MILRQPDDCSPWGIARPALPPDDAAQDAMCAIAAAVEHAYLDLHLAVAASPELPAIPGRAARTRPGDFDDALPTPAASTTRPAAPWQTGKDEPDRRYPPPGRQQG